MQSVKSRRLSEGGVACFWKSVACFSPRASLALEQNGVEASVTGLFVRHSDRGCRHLYPIPGDRGGSPLSVKREPAALAGSLAGRSRRASDNLGDSVFAGNGAGFFPPNRSFGSGLMSVEGFLTGEQLFH